jgi:hypothetical protein
MDAAPQVAPGYGQLGTRAAARQSGSGRDLDWRHSSRLRGSRQLKGRKAAPVLVAVEKRDRVTGRSRMALIPDFKNTTLLAFLKQNVIPGSTVYTSKRNTQSSSLYSPSAFAGLQSDARSRTPIDKYLRRHYLWPIRSGQDRDFAKRHGDWWSRGVRERSRTACRAERVDDRSAHFAG